MSRCKTKSNPSQLSLSSSMYKKALARVVQFHNFFIRSASASRTLPISFGASNAHQPPRLAPRAPATPGERLYSYGVASGSHRAAARNYAAPSGIRADVCRQADREGAL